MLASGPQNPKNLTLRLSIVVMPASTQKEESNLGIGNALPDLPEMPIKCWEVGCGTSLDDAVDHISKLPLNGALNIPPTPFSPGRFQTDGAGGGAGLQMSPDELMRTRSLAKENSIASEKAVLSSHTSLTTSSLQGLSLSRENTVLESETLQFSQSVPDNSLNILGDLGFRTYALRLSDYPLARITIHFPPSGQLEPGGTFYGTLEFDKSENGIRCIQVSILLEQDEIINEQWRVSRGRQGSDGALCRVIDEFEEATVNTACTSFVFSLPNDAVSTFHTDLISISWALKFHFVALVTGSNNLSKKPRMERLTWTMPLTIFPPS